MSSTRTPTLAQARRVCDRILAEATAAGRRPSVLAAARALGIPNTTFRRQFPDLVNELTGARDAPATGGPSTPGASTNSEVVARNARLRRENQRLREHLDLAVANIARLTLQNHQLLGQLEVSGQITSLASHKSRTR